MTQAEFHYQVSNTEKLSLVCYRRPVHECGYNIAENVETETLLDTLWSIHTAVGFFFFLNKYYHLILWMFTFKCLDSIVTISSHTPFGDCNIILTISKTGHSWESWVWQWIVHTICHIFLICSNYHYVLMLYYVYLAENFILDISKNYRL